MFLIYTLSSYCGIFVLSPTYCFNLKNSALPPIAYAFMYLLVILFFNSVTSSIYYFSKISLSYFYKDAYSVHNDSRHLLKHFVSITPFVEVAKMLSKSFLHFRFINESTYCCLSFETLSTYVICKY